MWEILVDKDVSTDPEWARSGSQVALYNPKSGLDGPIVCTISSIDEWEAEDGKTYHRMILDTAPYVGMPVIIPIILTTRNITITRYFDGVM